MTDRILILDDSVNRHRLFRAIYGARAAVHTHTVERFREQLDMFADERTSPDLEGFGVVFLDHDLTPQHYSGDVHDEECGCAAVRLLVAHYRGEPTRPRVVLHTRNGSAALKMQRELEAAGFPVSCLPFE